MRENLPVYNQGVTKIIATTLLDEDDDPIPTATLTTITATLYVRKGGAIINDRDAQDVKNANGGTYADGAFELKLSAIDNPHTGMDPIEEHVLLLRWTYNGGADVGVEEILLRVRDVGRL